MGVFKRKQVSDKPGHIDLAVDADGKRYTSHCFASDEDVWRGATILTPSVVRSLREAGKLPLTELTLSEDEKSKQ